ncbi:hypothetical protein ACVWWR_002478 [Bradyrhizobium sp. LM3.2]
MTIALLAHADRRDSEAEEAGVEAGQLRFDRRIIREIAVCDLGELGIVHAGRATADRNHAVDAGIDQAFAQNALPDHAGRAEDDDLHRDVSYSVAAHAAATISSKDILVNVAETSHSMAAEAKSFACGMIFAGLGGPFNS